MNIWARPDNEAAGVKNAQKSSYMMKNGGF